MILIMGDYVCKTVCQYFGLGFVCYWVCQFFGWWLCLSLGLCVSGFVCQLGVMFVSGFVCQLRVMFVIGLVCLWVGSM